MKRKIFITLALFLILFIGNIYSQHSIKILTGIVKPVKEKIQGFLGSYHPYNGDIYGGFGWKGGQSIQEAFSFGENAVISEASYSGYTFKENIINNCVKWNINKLYGMLAGISEKGVVNQPGDTALYSPYSHDPGMIQGAHRFSELSKIYPQIRGIIIDDFFYNYPKTLTLEDLRDIKDALLGKRIDKNGNVVHSSKATTPNLKLYIVVYSTQINTIDPKVLSLINGVSFWIYNQSVLYQNFNNYIKLIKKDYPGKEIIPGVYVYNSGYKYASPESIRYITDQSINLYKKGEVNGLLVFSPVWFSKGIISRDEWEKLALPRFLDSVYYPYLGEAESKIVDQGTGKPIENVIVTISRNVNNEKQIVAQKSTNDFGYFKFGALAGRKRSTLYKIRLNKPNYKTKVIYTKIKAGENVVLPDIKIKK